MYNIIVFIIAYFIFVIVHESMHILIAIPFNEYQSFVYKLIGPEVIYKTPIAEREGLKWCFISGIPNIVTLIIGYILFYFREILNQTPKLLKSLFFYLTVFFLLFDAFNLSLGPFIYGGDIGGISIGLGINQIIIQFTFFILLLINREIIIQKIFPVYRVETKHFLFKPLIKSK